MAGEHALTVISRHYQQGEPQDVLGLNRFTLLVDRSQTALTEVGWNYWKPDLDGPPHYHEAKEQFFFAAEGVGEVTIGGHTYRVEPGDLLHVPVGAMHRTVPLGGGQAFLLVNAFRDASKENKPTFADHLAVSKHERRQQADDANRGLAIDWRRVPAIGCRARVERNLPSPGAAIETVLIARERTLRLSGSLLRLGAGASLPGLDAPAPSELTVFGLAGTGRLEAARQPYPISTGTVIYIPPELPITAHAGPEGCLCLLIRTHLD